MTIQSRRSPLGGPSWLYYDPVFTRERSSVNNTLILRRRSQGQCQLDDSTGEKGDRSAYRLYVCASCARAFLTDINFDTLCRNIVWRVASTN